MRRTLIFFLCLFPLLQTVMFPARSAAQELVCDVRADLARLPSNAIIRLNNFEAVVRDYLNRFRWTTDDFEEEDRIKCQVQFIFISADINASPPVYSVQVTIGSSRPVFRSLKATSMIRTSDANLTFSYDNLQASLVHNEEIYGTLTSFLDFYALVVIGTDYDSFNPLGGSPFFERANRIARRAESQATFKNGWLSGDGAGINRAVFASEVVDPRFLPVREAFCSYHYDGLDEFHKEPVKARQAVIAALAKIAEIDNRFPRSMFIRRIFESKYIEIGELFKAAKLEERKQVYEVLLRVDPSHKQSYDQYISLTQ